MKVFLLAKALRYVRTGMPVIGGLILVLVSGCFDQKAEEILRNTPKGGWVTYWDYANGVNSIGAASSVFDDVLFFVAHLDNEGHVVLHRSIDAVELKGFVQRVNAYGKRAWLTVVNDVVDGVSGDVVLKDSITVGRILESNINRHNHIQELISLAQVYGFSGIDIDYENLQYELRDAFSLFATELSEASHSQKLDFSVTVQPKDREKTSMGAGTMNLKALCDVADRVQIMLYNEHSGRTEPGPMATPDWINAIIEYSLSKCERKKLVSVLKVSGMVWSESGTVSIQYDEVMKLLQEHQIAVQIDPRGQTPYFEYSDGNTNYTVFYENAASLMSKMNGILKQKLAGVVFWSIGRQDPALIQQLSGTENKK